jgi:hypothetical protein
MRQKPSPKIKPLRARQLNAMQMALDGFTGQEICERLGITNKTLWNWRQLPAWDEQFSVVLRGSSGDGEGQIRSMLPLATNRLRKLIHSTSETVALGACRTVLEAHANLVARLEQQELLGQLEQQLDEIRTTVANNGVAGQLNPSPYGVLDAEIVADSHASSHNEQQQEAVAQ